MNTSPTITCHRQATCPAPDLTVVVPAHNTELYVHQCLTSILNQPDIALEIVVIDDASQDKTLGVLKTLDDPRVTLLSTSTNLGASEARNQAITYARAAWICPFDSDDVMFKNTLAPYYQHVTHTPDSFWGYCGQRLTNSELQPLGTDMCSHFDFVLMLGSNMVCHGMSLYRKDIFESVGQYDPTIRIGEDYDLFLRFLQHGDPVFFNRICYFYRRHADNSNNFGHSRSATPSERLDDEAHLALRTRIADAVANETPRQTQIRQAFEMLQNAVTGQWEDLLQCSAQLGSVKSLWKDHLTATALTVLGRHGQAFSVMVPWLNEFNASCQLLPHEILLILQRTIELAANAGNTTAVESIRGLAGQIASATPNAVFAQKLTALAGC